MLCYQNACGECIRRIARQDRDFRLAQHRAVIQLRRHDMHGAAAMCIACLQRALMRASLYISATATGGY